MSFEISLIGRIYRRILFEIAKIVTSELKRFEPQLTLKNLSNDMLENCIILSDRVELLKNLKSNGVVAEIGVFKGDFSQKILKYSNPSKLHLIDSWSSKRYNVSFFNKIKEKFKSEINDNQIEIHRKLSVEAAKDFKKDYFDWIYIDSDHLYKVTKEELEAYADLVKKDGVIAGHDYAMGNWDRMLKYGVIEAVNEFCFENKWELIYLTHEIDSNYSFAIKRKV